MSRTPLNNRTITDGKERTPLANRAIKERSLHGIQNQQASIDQQLLDVLRSLNLAVAAVAHARDQRFHDPTASLSPQVAIKALLHLKDAAQQLDHLRKNSG
jgi:hypothetical protein